MSSMSLNTSRIEDNIYYTHVNLWQIDHTRRTPAAFIVTFSKFNNNKSVFLIPENTITLAAHTMLQKMTEEEDRDETHSLYEWWHKVAPRFNPYVLENVQFSKHKGSINIYTFYE